MHRFSTVIFLFCSIILYAQDRQNTALSPLKVVELDEVIVTNETLYDIYKKAAHNLKERLIKNKEIVYKVEGNENEEINGEERFLEVLFTAELEKVNSSKNKLGYRYKLSKLKHSPDVSNSQIMRHCRYCVPLFFDNIATEIKQHKLNTIESNDSLFFIYDRSNQVKENILYTINKKDTTLTKISVEKFVNEDKEYDGSRVMFKQKRLSGLLSAEYVKNSQGYYLGDLKMSGSRFFVFRRTKKEEQVSLNYHVKALFDAAVTTYTNFKPSTYKIFKKANTE